MATIASQASGPTNESTVEVLWETLTTTNRPGAGVAIAKFPDKTVQVLGTFGSSASIAIEGSNDGGTTWAACHDITGTVIALTAAGLVLVVESPKLIRPNLTSGNGSTDIDVYLIATVRGT